MADEGPLVRVIRAVCRKGSPFSSVERLVALAIASHMDRAGSKAWPSVRRIREWSGLGRTAVRSAVRRLAGKRGLFLRGPGGARPGSRYESPTYELREDLPPEGVATRPEGVATRPEGVATRPPEGVATRPEGVATRPEGVATRPRGGRHAYTEESIEESIEESRTEERTRARARAVPSERPDPTEGRTIPANPLVGDRVARERELHELVRREAELTNRDGAEVMAEVTTYPGARTSKLNPAAMSDDRLLNSLLDARARVKRLEVEARP